VKVQRAANPGVARRVRCIENRSRPDDGAARRGGDLLQKMIRRIALAGLVVLAVFVLAPSAALAQYREFTGKIDKINDKKMIVDNRQGDKVTFDKVKDTKVDDTSGESKKKAWADLKNNDWVTVKWKMIDKPRKAYEVIVLPPKEEAGEDL
jgi:hypothetical protein